MNRPACVLKRPTYIMKRPAGILRRPVCILKRPACILRTPTCVLKRPSHVLKRPTCIMKRPVCIVKRPVFILNRLSPIPRTPACVMKRPICIIRHAYSNTIKVFHNAVKACTVTSRASLFQHKAAWISTTHLSQRRRPGGGGYVISHVWRHVDLSMFWLSKRREMISIANIRCNSQCLKCWGMTHSLRNCSTYFRLALSSRTS